MKQERSKGFTLFELLVSISIIGVLTALAIVSYSNAQKKARDSKRIQDITTIQKAAESFYSSSGGFVYPLDESVTNWITSNNEQILNVYPVDPKTGVAYSFEHPNGNDTFCVCAELEDKSNGNSTGDSDEGCDDFSNASGVVKDYFCAKSQQ